MEVQSLQAEPHCDVVRIVRGLRVADSVHLLPDRTSDQRAGAPLHQRVQILVEWLSASGVAQDYERSLGLADVVLVEDHLIVSEVLELELQHVRCGSDRVLLLVEDAEGKDEHRIVRIDAVQPVIATLVDKGYVVAGGGHGVSSAVG